MAYDEFSIEEIKTRFQLRIAEAEEYFAHVPPVVVGDFLTQMLAEASAADRGPDSALFA